MELDVSRARSDNTMHTQQLASRKKDADQADDAGAHYKAWYKSAWQRESALACHLITPAARNL